MLVRSPKEGQLDRRPQANHPLEYRSGGQDADTKHATQKPVECMRRPMLNNSSPGQAVYEPFLGSEPLLSRRNHPAGCVSVSRSILCSSTRDSPLQVFTGEKAIRAGDGICFEVLDEEARSAERAS